VRFAIVRRRADPNYAVLAVGPHGVRVLQDLLWWSTEF
jgi:hypothetical protein